jgi:HCOMODA/2-hydroxy-3-carboxy-muconic semialdehyde decarboxylase
MLGFQERPRLEEERPVPLSLDQARYEVARANRTLANEGVLDGFGHVSMRHPADPQRYLLSRSRSPELIQPEDILEFTLDSAPVKKPNVELYAERVIHGCIYQARPDVSAVVHHHSPDVMPFAISGTELVPVFHLGAVTGPTVPFWNQADEFGDTNMLVVQPEEGRSLADALGPHNMVLMRNHGATVVAGDLPKLVFRAIFSCMNARYQLQAAILSRVTRLRDGEIRLAGAIGDLPTAIIRASEYWSMRLDKAEGNTRPSGKRAKAPWPASATGSTSKKPRASNKQTKGMRKGQESTGAKGRKR